MSAPAGEKVFLRQGHLLTKVRDDDHSGYPSLVPEQLLVVKLSNSTSDIRVLGTTQACDAPTVVRHEFRVQTAMETEFFRFATASVVVTGGP